MTKKEENLPSGERRTPRYETADATPSEKPKRTRRRKDTFSHAGGCWCGKGKAGCDGTPTTVRILSDGVPLFICPFGRDNSSVPAAVRAGAVEAGIIEE